jgi:hypothetical protein
VHAARCTQGLKALLSSRLFVPCSGLQYAQQPVVKLTLRQMLEFGQSAWLDQAKLIESAEFVREEVGG